MSKMTVALKIIRKTIWIIFKILLGLFVLYWGLFFVVFMYSASVDRDTYYELKIGVDFGQENLDSLRALIPYYPENIMPKSMHYYPDYGLVNSHNETLYIQFRLPASQAEQFEIRNPVIYIQPDVTYLSTKILSKDEDGTVIEVCYDIGRAYEIDRHKDAERASKERWLEDYVIQDGRKIVPGWPKLWKYPVVGAGVVILSILIILPKRRIIHHFKKRAAKKTIT